MHFEIVELVSRAICVWSSLRSFRYHVTHFKINSGSVRLLPQYLEYVEFIPLFVCCTSVSRVMILILLRFSIRKVRILNLILFSILLLVSRILCVCSPLRLLRYYLVHLTLIPSAFLRGRPKSPTFQRNTLQHYWIVLWDVFRSWPNVRNMLQHPKFSQQKSDHFQTWSNTTQHLATCGNILLQGGQRCATLHTTILQDVMLKCCAGHVGVSYPLVWFSLRLLRFYMTQLILILVLCPCYRTLVPCTRWIYSSLR